MVIQYTYIGNTVQTEKNYQYCSVHIKEYPYIFLVIVKLLSRMASTSGSFTNKPSLQDIQGKLINGTHTKHKWLF